MSRLADLRQATVEVWNDFLTGDDDQIASGWMRWEQSVAERVARPGNRVLVIGCGSGRDLIPFFELGCSVTGIDPAPGAVAAAERALARRNLTATLHTAFFEDLALTDRYDVVWFSWYAYSYIPDSQRRIDALRQASGLLTERGQIVLSVLLHPPESRLARLAMVLNRWTHADWTMSDGDVFTRVVGSAVRYEHYFADGEVDKEFSSAGLHTVASLDAGSVHILAR